MLGRYDSQKTGFGTLFMVWWGIIDIEQVVGERSRCLTTSLLCRYQVFCSCASVAIQKRGCIERCNLFLRAESEIWTRDPFITSEVLYRWANSAFDWKSIDYSLLKDGNPCGVQQSVQQSLSAITCWLMISGLFIVGCMRRGLYRDKLSQRGIFETPLQSLSSEKIDCFCPCKKILDCMAEDVSLI